LSDKRQFFSVIDFTGLFASFCAPLIGIQMKTHLPKVNLDQRKWHVIDADGVVLGRLAAQVADILRGKNKPVFTPHLDAGDFVVVVNAERVRVTGKKETNKKYMSYSGWKGGEKFTTVAELRARHPEMLIHRAVRGMIPKNRLGRVLLTKLKVYKGKEHPHAAQRPEVLAGAK
jgi:large subunit ribosomal protein L13